jgi:5-methyltetrahydropteroyltriglutamate--homocysteine methyltransferase
MHMFRLDQTIEPGIYDSTKDYFADLAQVYREEIKALAEAGSSYIQLDDVPIPMLSDPTVQARVKEDGIDPTQLMNDYIDLFNDCLRDRPDGVTIAVHMCRGNYKGKFLSEGGYETFAEKFFNELNVDAFFLEYDSPRSGDFEPLKYVPKNKIVVLGLVSSKTPQMESQDDLRSRIDEAAQYIDLDQLALSPQCGFASTVAGNPITVDDEKAKLAMIVEVAGKVWG